MDSLNTPMVRFMDEDSILTADCTLNSIAGAELREQLRRETDQTLHRLPSALKLSLPQTPMSPDLPGGTIFDRRERKEMKPWAESNSARGSLLTVLSALYALVLVILSLAFEVAGLINDDVNASKYDIFYIYLYFVGLLFFAYCYLFLMRTKGWNVPVPFFNNKRGSMKSSTDSPPMPDLQLQIPAYDIPLLSAKRKVTHSAQNAGSFYLRLGAIIFGVVGLIDRALQIFQAVDNGLVPHCYGGVNVFEDVVAMVFIFVQLYFIFQNAQLTIHRFREVGRFGTMHLIATNLSTWIRAVVVEEYHIFHEIKESMKHENLKHSNLTADHHGDATAIHDESILSILNNVSDSLHSSLADPHAKCQFSDHESVFSNAKPFMTTCLIEYSLICAAVAYIMWRNIGHSVHKRSKFRKQNFQIDCSSSTKGLFVGLLFVVFTLVSMVIFFSKLHSERNSEALWVFYFSDCALYLASIVALIVASYKMRNLYFVTANHKGILLDDILLIVALVGQLMFCIFSIIALTKWAWTSVLIVVVSMFRMIEVLMQTVFILVAQRLIAATADMQAKKPGREMITFLLLANLAMFLINTFETQKAGANPLTMDFYGQSIWTVIVHSTAPLSIFYRFHSSVCFAEIWKCVYRVKEHVAV